MQLEGQSRSLTRLFTRHTFLCNPIAIEPHSKGRDKQKRQESARVTAVSKRRGWNCRVLHRLGLP